MKDQIAANILRVRGEIADACELYDRDADDVNLVAVTKTRPAAIVRLALAAGIHDIAESRVQEAETKFPEVGPSARFHMVGHLQTNKVKKAVELFDVIQSVDSLKLAEEINKQAGIRDRNIECYLEVNCSGESAKTGFAPDDCLESLKQINQMSNIRLTGLMTIGPHTDDETAIRAAFAQCRNLYRSGRDMIGEEFDTLSMGMSSDFAIAIAEGSTMVRIGTALFGGVATLT